MRNLVALALATSLFGCAGPADPDVDEGLVAHALRAAAREAEVPRDLLVAIAIEEGGLALAPRRTFHADDHVPVAGYLELRHGAFDSLKRGAELVGVSEEVLVEDTVLATRAAALVLAEVARATSAQPDDIASYAPALAMLSGMTGTAQHAYVERVFDRYVAGAHAPAFAGELVHLPSHARLDRVAVAFESLGTPDYPGALWFETSCTGKCNIGRGGKVVDTILIHDTEGSWNASVATLQNDPGKSVHYIIDADGSRVGQFRPETDITWHCGNSFYNGKSIGIEHVGTAANPDGYAAAMYTTSVALVQNIRTRNTVALDRAHIIGHYQVPKGSKIGETSAPCSDPILTCESSPNYGGANNHSDPGPKWQWCQYMQKLGGACTCNDAFSHFNCTTDKTQAVRCAANVVEIRDCQDPCVVQAIGVDDTCEPAMDVPDLGTTDGSLPAVDGAIAPEPGDMGMVANDDGCDCDVGGRHASTPLSAFALVALLAGLYRRRSARR